MLNTGSEQQLGVSIAEQCNLIKSVLNDIAAQEQGIAIIAANIDEKLLTGFNNTIGPKILITFVGEDPVGGEDVSELLGMTRRYFDILVQRAKVICDPRNTALTSTTGPSKPFYDLLEIIRDTTRSIEWPTPMCLNPCEYHGMRPAQQDGWLLDSYIINISVMTQIGRVQVDPAAISSPTGGPFVQLQDPLDIQFIFEGAENPQISTIFHNLPHKSIL